VASVKASCARHRDDRSGQSADLRPSGSLSTPRAPFQKQFREGIPSMTRLVTADVNRTNDLTEFVE
jgi:hypothetical protein